MEDWKRDGDVEDEAFEPLVEESDDDDDAEAHARHATGTSNRSTLWVILATTSTLMGRRVLTTGFRMFCFYFFLIRHHTFRGTC
jgi:hypothetical protein